MTLRTAAACVVLLLAIAAVLLGHAPLWVPIVYLAFGVVSIVVYWFDKRAAQADHWRVSERSLHTIDLIGGIAGGLVAQQLLRHKTSKRSFATVTLLIALLHAGVLAGLLVLAPFG